METPILTAVADPAPTIRMPVPPKGEAYLVGRRGSPHVHEYRDFLERNRVSFRWIDIDRNPLVRFLGASPSLRRRALPFFLFADGSHLDVSQDPDPELAFTRTRAELAQRVGLHARPGEERYDVMIIGAGPAGLTAAVSAASEGLRALVVERHAPGGQAGASTRIENYPGFSQGISGSELAQSAYDQAMRFGAEIVVGSEMLESWLDSGGSIVLELATGDVVSGRALIGAMGSQYRRLDAAGVDELIGAGVYYGSAPSDVLFHRDGDVSSSAGPTPPARRRCTPWSSHAR